MRKLARSALLGAALSLAIANTGQAKNMIKKTVKIERWTCPAGSRPDDKNRTPNCDIQEPIAQAPACAQQEGQAAAGAGQDQEQDKEKEAAECPAAEQVLLEKRVDFAPGATEVGAQTEATLDEVATAAADGDVKQIRIEGHADNTGTAEINETIASTRAENTKNYLVEQGVPEELITTESFSDSAPVASNESADGRALNRSAAVMIIK